MNRLLLIVLFGFVMCQHPLHAEQMDDGSCATIGKFFVAENSGMDSPEAEAAKLGIKNKIKDAFKDLDKIAMKNTGASYLDEITDDQFDAMAESVFLSCAWAPYGNIGERTFDVYLMMAGPASFYPDRDKK